VKRMRKPERGSAAAHSDVSLKLQEDPGKKRKVGDCAFNIGDGHGKTTTWVSKKSCGREKVWQRKAGKCAVVKRNPWESNQGSIKKLQKDP